MSKSVMFEIETQQAPSFRESIVTRYIVAVLGSWCAELVSYPFDLAKTRLQIQNEVAAKKHGMKMENRGMVLTAIHIFTHEGPFKLYSGMLPMCHRHIIYSGTRLVLYEQARKMLKDETGRMTLLRTMLSGATCGAIAQLMASPADLVKVQMQAEGRRILQGLPPRFKGCLEVYRMVYQQSGILGFWREKEEEIENFGYILHHYHVRGTSNLVGSDKNVNMVNFANEQNRNTQTSFIVSDIADEIPEEMKRSFDHVFSFYVLHWVQNHKQVFKNIFDLLEENGQFFSIFLGSNPYHQIFLTMSQDRVLCPFEQEAEQHILPCYDYKEPEKEITKLMETSGFIDVDVKCEDKVFQCDDMHLFKKHFIAVTPFKLSDEMLEKAFENFIRMLKEIEIAHGVNNPPNIVNIYYELLKVYGQKPPV